MIEWSEHWVWGRNSIMYIIGMPLGTRVVGTIDEVGRVIVHEDEENVKISHEI